MNMRGHTMAPTTSRDWSIGLAEVTLKLRTASPAEADRSPLHEEPVSLANSIITIWAGGV